MTDSEKIKLKAIELGFDRCGMAQAMSLTEETLVLHTYLNSGFHGNMSYMENHFDKRTDPLLLVPGAKSVISLLLNYFPSEKQSENLPQIAKYAYGRDYHKVIKGKLKKLYQWMEEEFSCTGRFFVDSAPVLERVWAMRAGLGWIGKNGCLINRDLGSFVFISEIIVDLELDYDNPEFNHCGTCKRCMDDCPTKAIVKPHVVDGSKCIAYYTIEDKSVWDENVPELSNRIYGCDICQDVCPWNKKALPHHVPDFNPTVNRLNLDVEAWRNMADETYEELFFGSAIKRASLKMLKRNSAHL